MKRFFVFLAVICSCACCTNGYKYDSMNLDFELKDDNPRLPKYWYTGDKSYRISLDSVEKHSGQLSLKMEKLNNWNETSFGVFTGTLPVEIFAGKNVEYRGWIKTKDVKNGYAGLWMRADGEEIGMFGFDNMHDRGLTGTNEWTQVSIMIDISSEATNINYGGLFPGEGVVWFDNLELFVNGKKFIEPKLKVKLTRQEKKALREYIYPLRTYEPDDGDSNDLDILKKLIGNSRVIALGEVSHGSSEIFKMKNRIIQYLATNYGFDIFSIEGNMPEAYKLNDYIVRGEGDPKKLIAGMYFWTWRTEEVLDMVEWMHRFNQPKQRITFTGFDMQFYEGAVNELLDAFKGNEDATNRIANLKKILDKIKTRSQYNHGMPSVGENEMKEIDLILSFLQNSIETLPNKNWLQQNIAIIQQYLENNISLWRDKCMADNFLWIKEHNPNSKFAIWAHNAHIQKTGQMMGSHLSQKLGDEYITFGFTFYDGSFTAAGSKGLTSYDAQQGYPGTLEYLLEQLKEPIFILDLKRLKSENNKDTEWITQRLAYRFVGSTGGDPNEFWRNKISDDFDYLIFIKTSTPSALFANPR